MHQKYLQSGYPPVSYTKFLRMKPFWVVKPDINQRDTCLCQPHANMELLITSLKTNKNIKESSMTNVLESLCCNKYNPKCLQRECPNCPKNIQYQEFNNSNQISYWKWEKKDKVFKKNGVEKTIKVIEKVRCMKKPLEVIAEFEKALKPFLKHCGNITNQYNAVKYVKKNLSDNECLIHMDFSENYAGKYNSEVQSVHFGCSREQLTLHTAVIYYRSGETQYFCSVSNSLRHDASAVWAHLVPILREIEETVPTVSVLHVVSDSPSGQYRNKKIFYIMSQLASYISTLTRVVWYYSECGHGKGAPDGVGGVLKRTADQLVAFGTDITNIDTLVDSLKSAVKGVKIVTVQDYEITEKDWLLPNTLKAFPGTLKVHQAIWSANLNNQVVLRSLSCIKPECLLEPIECLHGKHLGILKLCDEKSMDLNSEGHLKAQLKHCAVQRFKGSEKHFLDL